MFTILGLYLNSKPHFRHQFTTLWSSLAEHFSRCFWNQNPQTWHTRFCSNAWKSVPESTLAPWSVRGKICFPAARSFRKWILFLLPYNRHSTGSSSHRSGNIYRGHYCVMLSSSQPLRLPQYGYLVLLPELGLCLHSLGDQKKQKKQNLSLFKQMKQKENKCVMLYLWHECYSKI